MNHLALISSLLGLAWAAAAPAPAVMDPPAGRPDAIIDLGTREGAQLVKGTWRYSNTRIVEVDAKGPGLDLKPSGAPIKTLPEFRRKLIEVRLSQSILLSIARGQQLYHVTIPLDQG